MELFKKKFGENHFKLEETWNKQSEIFMLLGK